MEKDYKKYIKELSVYDLADEFNSQTFIVNDKKKFNEVLLIDHFENVDYIERLETELKKQKEIIAKAIEYIKDYASYVNHLSIDKEKEIGYLKARNVKDLLQILEDKEV